LFCGRMGQRVETPDGPLHTEQVEPVFNVHPEVRRSALVGVGAIGEQRPILCVEPHHTAVGERRQHLLGDLQALAARHRHTASITTFLFHPGFPVDIRHNAKIGREALARWAAEQLAVQR